MTAFALMEAQAVNLVPNGEFSAGNTGFTTDYTLANDGPSGLVPEGVYLIGPNPSLYHSAFANYGDHTTGTGTMMIVNGAPDITAEVWRTQGSIPVQANTDYFFEAWISSAHGASPAALTFALDGDDSDAILGVGSAPSTPGVWTPLSFTWNSGNNTSVQLFLQNANPEPSGNDFAIDDIYLGETTSVPTPDTLSSLGVLGFAVACLSRMNLRLKA